MNQELYRKYIADMAPGWTTASIRSENTRLNRLWEVIDGDAGKLWAALSEHGRYSRATYWTRVSAFMDWCIENGHATGPNPYRVFRKKHKRNFLGAYERRPPKDTMEDAYRRILTIENAAIRNKCLQLLTAGLRWTESFTLEDGYVLGKGNKRRKVYPMPIAGPMAEKSQYGAVLRALKKIGISGPHKLRGIFLSDLVKRKIDSFELQKVAGWSSLATAQSYIHANDDRIAELVAQAQSV